MDYSLLDQTVAVPVHDCAYQGLEKVKACDLLRCTLAVFLCASVSDYNLLEMTGLLKMHRSTQSLFAAAARVILWLFFLNFLYCCRIQALVSGL
jgi:hypothetical protein